MHQAIEATSTPPEALVFFDQNTPGAQVHAVAGGRAAVHSSRCPGKEAANEDAAALIPFDADSAVLLVADGLGGGPAGEQASRVAVHNVRAALQRAARHKHPIRTGILNGIEHANQEICNLSLGAATTLAVVEIQDRLVRPYHIGDSLIVVTGGRGKIKLQTVSHSPVGFAVEAGLLNETDAIHHEDRHIVSNVIGTPNMRIEIGSTLTMAPRDSLLLASDGLFDNLHTEEIVARLRQGTIEASAQRLADDAMARMVDPQKGQPSKPDDMTFVLFRLSSAPRRGSA